MKVFLSWSGNKSHKVALVFRDWLPSVIQSLVPYVSSEDIDKGARWSTDIAKELEDSTFGMLCVTKDNVNAPWLTFEAGALSKTMDKAFVCPFLFDIKRSEVDGPILQFQSTIFERADIQKLVRTLNKACANDNLSDERLDKAFDVWYPTLESGLEKLKAVEVEPSEKKIKGDENKKRDEILEEILELTRINQKLLRNPEGNFLDSLSDVKGTLMELRNRIEKYQEIQPRRPNRKINPMLIEELMHISPMFEKNFIGIQIMLSLLKDDFPWLYEAGREVLDIMKSRRSRAEKEQAIQEFAKMVEFSFEHPVMREFFGYNKELRMIYRDLPHIFMKTLQSVIDR